MHELVFQICHQKNTGTIAFLSLKLLCFLTLRFILLLVCIQVYFIMCMFTCLWRPGEANSMQLELQAAVSCYPVWVVGSELKSSARASRAPIPRAEPWLSLAWLLLCWPHLPFQALPPRTTHLHCSRGSCCPMSHFPTGTGTAETGVDGMLGPFCL